MLFPWLLIWYDVTYAHPRGACTEKISVYQSSQHLHEESRDKPERTEAIKLITLDCYNHTLELCVGKRFCNFTQLSCVCSPSTSARGGVDNLQRHSDKLKVPKCKELLSLPIRDSIHYFK